MLFKRKKEKAVQPAEAEKKQGQKAIPTAVKTHGPEKARSTGVIRGSRVTEKSSLLMGGNKYVFTVSNQANKNQIASDITAKFGVEVVDVNTINLPAKKRRRGAVVGYKPGVKKAIVTVKEGQKIEIN